MTVILLTLVISLCLVFTFVLFFLREHSRSRLSSPERDSMLPFDEEKPHTHQDPAHVISFRGCEPGARKSSHHAPCDSGKAEHERCHDCPSRQSQG